MFNHFYKSTWYDKLTFCKNLLCIFYQVDLWRTPKFLIRPKKGPTMLKSESSWNLVPLLASSIKGGERGVLKALGLDSEEGQLLVTRSCIKTNHKLVSSPLETLLVLGQAMGNTDSFDSSQPGFGGSHHLPPYSIFCVAPPHLHLNGF